MNDLSTINQFKKQIQEDIELIQKKFVNLDSRLKVNDYAFNFWILDNIYNIDEQLIPDLITDRNDKAIDCYVHYPESKILYLIQNKYYDDSTTVTRGEVVDFLTSPLDHLTTGIYKRNTELQKLFTAIKDDKEYKFYLHFYVTTCKMGADIEQAFRQFNAHPKYHIGEFVRAEFIRIGDLYDKYYGLQYKEQINFKYTLKTKVSRNILNILPEDYKLPEMSKAYYMLTPVWQIWDMLKKAKEKKYPLFEENIRNYLGDNDINGNIIKTLKNPKDRSNFFYYNNGITMICEDIPKDGSTLTVIKPQIINGCQTVNSIFQCLEDYATIENVQQEFQDVFVMAKILLFDKKTREQKTDNFYNDIVKYNNKQNPLSEKAFATKKCFFAKMQACFKDRGFLLLVQPSDKNKCLHEITEEEAALLLQQANNYACRIGLSLTKKKDLFIPLEKLLQVYIAFITDGFHAFTKKSSLLKEKSEWYEKYTMKLNQLSADSLIWLWLMYVHAESERLKSADQTTPIPYYLIGFFGHMIQDKTKRDSIIRTVFSNSHNSYHNLFDYLTKLTTEYKIAYLLKNKDRGKDYNHMIKDKIDTELLDTQIATINRIAINRDLKVFLEPLN